MAKSRFSFVVEHLDPELGPWSALEYRTIAHEAYDAGCTFILSSVPEHLLSSEQLKALSHAQISTRGVESLFSENKSRVCLLDPAAQQELSPDDADTFDVFLFGGILGDDPPRDRTSELRHKGYTGRRLGPKQMTTDTAVRVTRMVVQDKIGLKQIPYVDYPELKLDEHESTEMPFRYVKGANGEPVLPEGMLQLIKEDADKSFEDLEVIDDRDTLESGGMK